MRCTVGYANAAALLPTLCMTRCRPLMLQHRQIMAASHSVSTDLFSAAAATQHRGRAEHACSLPGRRPDKCEPLLCLCCAPYTALPHSLKQAAMSFL